MDYIQYIRVASGPDRGIVCEIIRIPGTEDWIASSRSQEMDGTCTALASGEPRTALNLAGSGTSTGYRRRRESVHIAYLHGRGRRLIVLPFSIEGE